MEGLEGSICKKRSLSPLTSTLQICLRASTFLLTSTAACILIKNKQTVSVGEFVFEARFEYSPEFKLLVAVDLIAAAFSILSMLYLIIYKKKGLSPNLYFLLFIIDLLMLCIVLAGTAAATTIGLLGKKGNNHIGWMPIYDQFGKFCNKAAAGIGLSYAAAVLLLVISVMSACQSRQV